MDRFIPLYAVISNFRKIPIRQIAAWGNISFHRKVWRSSTWCLMGIYSDLLRAVDWEHGPFHLSLKCFWNVHYSVQKYIFRVILIFKKLEQILTTFLKRTLSFSLKERLFVIYPHLFYFILFFFIQINVTYFA